MDSFEYQTITALKKIRNANRRPDAKKIFKTITKESASNLTLDDVQQKLHEMQSSSKLRNTPYQGLDSYYIVQSDTGDTITSSEDILKTFCDETDIDCDIGLNVSGGTPSMVRNKTANSLSDLSQNTHIQLVDIKAYFVNEIDELKKEIKSLKQQVNCKDKLVAENNSEVLLKSQISFLQEQSSFIKTELQQKQIAIEKLLDLLKNRFQNNCFESTSKTPDSRLSNFNKMNRLNPVDGSRENPQSDVKQKNNHYNNPN